MSSSRADLGSMDLATFLAFADNESFFDDMEGKILVSSMVQDAVAKGFLKAIEEECSCKDQEIDRLQNMLEEKDACISDLQKVMGVVACGDASDGSGRSKSKQLWAFLQESQEKWRESEVTVSEKERELERLASSMACMALMLDNESKRATAIEKQLNDVKEQEAMKSGQISSLQQEIVKLKVDNSRLKRQARVKMHQFDESKEQAQRELRQERIESEKLVQENKTLEMTLEDRNRAYSDLEAAEQALRMEVQLLNEKLEASLEVERGLREEFEGQKLMQTGERLLLATYLEEQMTQVNAELEKDLRVRPSLVTHQDTDIIELTWKANMEARITEVVMEGWYKELTEVLHKLTYELAWKDEEIFHRDEEVGSLKQVVEELENDYATLMSICLTLFRDQNDDEPRIEPTSLSVHELGRRKLMELTELLNSRDVSNGHDEKFNLDSNFDEELVGKQLQHDLELETFVEVLKQVASGDGGSSMEISRGQEHEPLWRWSLEEELMGQRIRHELELHIVSEVCVAKLRETQDKGLSMDSDLVRAMETSDLKPTNNFEELEAHLESFLELEASRLERIKTGCSSSIAECEFKLDRLMKDLGDQVNEMKTKITFVQHAIKEQEWRHVVEEDILVLVLWNALAEMHGTLKLEESVQRHMRPHFISNDFKSSVENLEVTMSPKLSGDLHGQMDTDSNESENHEQVEYRLPIKDKDKLICLLKGDIEELRKEKVIIEQKLDERTEELYSLKRQFWKEREIWVSKLSQPQKKEVESQVEALSRHSSAAAIELEEEFKKLEEARFETFVSGLREEWLVEKRALLCDISRKESKIEGLSSELSKVNERENNRNDMEAALLAHIAELKMQVDNLTRDRLNQDFQFAKWKHEWEREKVSMQTEIDSLLEKECEHIASQGRLSARIGDLEGEMDRLSARLIELESEASSSAIAREDYEYSLLKVKQDWQVEKDHLSACILEVESERDRLCAQIIELQSERESLQHETGDHESSIVKLRQEWQVERDKLISTTKGLESERDWLVSECSRKERAATYLVEEKEIALALALKEKEEEEKRRKVLESQVQGLRLELRSLDALYNKVALLEGQLDSVPRQLESKLSQRISQSMEVFQGFEQKVLQMMQEKSTSLDRLKDNCRLLRGHLHQIAIKERQHKQRLTKEQINLQKAEAEVDLLGDEVESLLDVLEEVQVTFDQYAPILQYYPKMAEVAKLVKQEIQLRIDTKYGA